MNDFWVKAIEVGGIAGIVLVLMFWEKVALYRQIGQRMEKVTEQMSQNNNTLNAFIAFFQGWLSSKGDDE